MPGLNIQQSGIVPDVILLSTHGIICPTSEDNTRKINGIALARFILSYLTQSGALRKGSQFTAHRQYCSPDVHEKSSFRDYDAPVNGLLGHVSFRWSLPPLANRNRH